VVGVDEEKTILQQIREKEQMYGQKLEGIKAETEAAVAAARKNAADLISAAENAGKNEAERLFLEEKGRADEEVQQLKKHAALERDAAVARGEKNLVKAVEKITVYVIAE
jgi:vacuolar-type H+-ATPase subunit H